MHLKLFLQYMFALIVIQYPLHAEGYANHMQADTSLSISLDIGYKINTHHTGQEICKLDIYQPKLTENHFTPVIIFVHGGGFWEGDKRSALYIQMATAFARKGYTAVSVNYRLRNQNAPYTQAVLDTCVADIKAALHWVKVNSTRLHADTSLFFICGDSAGGGIIINTAYDPLITKQFKACIDLWGGLPGTKSWEAPIYSKRFNKHLPPTCIIHGSMDRIVPYATSTNLANKLKGAGVFYQLYRLRGADHYAVDRASEFIPVMLAFTGKFLKKH